MSYQETTFTSLPSTTIVSGASNTDEYDDVTMSLDTIGSSLYWRMPSKRPVSACSAKAALTSSALVSRDTSHTRSTTEPVITGARTAIPFSLPSSSGITTPIALAAPVEVGTRFAAAARARRRSLCGPSWRFWSEV